MRLIYYIILLQFIFLSVAFNGRAQTIPYDEYRPADLTNAADTIRIYYAIKDAVTFYIYNKDSSLAIINQQVAKSKKLNYPGGAFSGLFFLGVLNIYEGRYEQARKFLEEANVYAGKTTVENICRTLNNLGNVYYFQGYYKQAAEYYFHAIKIAEDYLPTVIPNRASDIANPLCRIYISAANTLMQMREYNRAMYYLNKAEVLATIRKITQNLPNVYSNKAIIYNKTGDAEKARIYNRKALTLATKLKMEEPRYIALHNEGDFFLSENHIEKAIQYFEKALESKGNINPYYRVNTFLSLGIAYFRLNNYKRAEQYLLEGYRKADSLKLGEQLLGIHQQLATLYAATGNYPRAYIHDHAAYILNDTLLNKEKTAAVTQLEIKARTVEKEKEIARKELLINEQKRKLYKNNIWIISTISGIGMLVLLFIGFYRNSQHKQRLHTEQLRTMKQETEIALLQAMMKGEEKQRVRFAQELHDGISSQLSAIRLYIGTLLHKKANDKINEDLEHMMQMLNEAASDVRQTAHNLIPDGLIRQGLADATRSFCEQLSHGENLQIELQTYGEFGALQGDLELFIYRTIQELLHNVIKHAKATHSIVLLNHQNNILGVTVEDNGVGMDINTINNDGMGLKSIEERAKTIGGSLVIESAQEKGTTVYMEIPFKKDVKMFSDENTHSYHG